MAKGADARGVDTRGEGAADRPIVPRAERLRLGQLDAERARARRLGMGNLHDKFKVKVAELKAKIESGNFDATAESIDLGIGMSDSELSKEAARRYNAKRNAEGPIPPLSPADASAYEQAQLEEYEAAVEAAELGAKKVKKTGLGSTASQAMQYQREQKVRDMKTPIEVVRDEYELLDDVPGAKELEELLNEQGFKIVVDRKGKVWTFTAVPKEADVFAEIRKAEVATGIAAELIPADESPEAKERREDRESQLVKAAVDAALDEERKKIQAEKEHQDKLDEIAKERAALQRERELFDAERRGYQAGVADGKKMKKNAQGPNLNGKEPGAEAGA